MRSRLYIATRTQCATLTNCGCTYWVWVCCSIGGHGGYLAYHELGFPTEARWDEVRLNTQVQYFCFLGPCSDSSFRTRTVSRVAKPRSRAQTLGTRTHPLSHCAYQVRWLSSSTSRKTVCLERRTAAARSWLLRLLAPSTQQSHWSYHVVGRPWKSPRFDWIAGRTGTTELRPLRRPTRCRLLPITTRHLCPLTTVSMNMCHLQPTTSSSSYLAKRPLW